MNIFSNRLFTNVQKLGMMILLKKKGVSKT